MSIKTLKFISLISIFYWWSLAFAADPSFRTTEDKKMWLSTIRCSKNSSVVLWKSEKSSFIRVDPNLWTELKINLGIKLFIESAQKNQDLWQVKARAEGGGGSLIEFKLSATNSELTAKGKTISELSCEVGEPVEAGVKIIIDK